MNDISHTANNYIEEAAAGLSLPLPLRPYQWEGVSFLYRGRAVLLADEMGLGKTVQVAVALSLILRAPEYNRALVVAPASLLLNWQRELEKWAPSLVVRLVTGNEEDRLSYYNLPIQVLIASYDQIRLDALERVPPDAFDIVVLDEAQRTKNKSSLTALACRLLPRKVSWALTATPLENSAEELESIFGFLVPGFVNSSLTKSDLFKRIEGHLLAGC
jgi:SNF2 family DNA or RNA helicase